MTLDCFVSNFWGVGYVGVVSLILDCFLSGYASKGYVGVVSVTLHFL